MSDEDGRAFGVAGRLDPSQDLRGELPPLWRGPIIGPGIEGWESIGRDQRRIDLSGLPDPFPSELAWMAYWQVVDGSKCSTAAFNHLARVLRHVVREGPSLPASMRALDWAAAVALQGRYYAACRRRLPPAHGARSTLRVLFRFPRLALLARCCDGPWWGLDDWQPRCDRRIPLSAREPAANYGCSPGKINQPWLRSAAKWHLGTALESGALRWSTVSQERMGSLQRLDRWLADAFDDPRELLGDPRAAPEQAAAFRRWDADPANRVTAEHRRATAVAPRLVNDDLRAVGELFAFIAANPAEARRVLGPSPWEQVTQAHADSWFRQVCRIPRRAPLGAHQYVDDHALGQITAALPLLGLPHGQHTRITRGDGRQVDAEGFDDPQVMRMILLQILTGRRASEIRTCDFDCLSPAPDGTVEITEGGGVTRFTYAQSKIDIAPDSILVDHEVTAVIEEQQTWVRERFPGSTTGRLFPQLTGNRHGAKPYPQGTYNWRLRQFSDLAQILDSKGKPVRLSHTHRFRHTKLTRLAELGLPIHVLQRYAGHASPSMSMHYIAQREEHAEQAFLATRKLKADGTSVVFSRDDHDRLHLFDRADRLLPHGWCLLPPLQTCDKGNACLTCSVFVTDDSHTQTLTRQLEETEALIQRTTTTFLERHGRPMPDDNVWLAQRHAERAALQRLLATLNTKPDRACQGAGCPTTPASGPVPITLQRRGTSR